jgi:putative intracellular protease/amidase
MANKKHRILIVLSEFGFWGEELIGSLETFDQSRYDVDFATPKGKGPVAMPASKGPYYIDGPLGRSSRSQKVAETMNPNSYLTGQKMVEAIDNGSTHYGW